MHAPTSWRSESIWSTRCRPRRSKDPWLSSTRRRLSHTLHNDARTSAIRPGPSQGTAVAVGAGESRDVKNECSCVAQLERFWFKTKWLRTRFLAATSDVFIFRCQCLVWSPGVLGFFCFPWPCCFVNTFLHKRRVLKAILTCLVDSSMAVMGVGSCTEQTQMFSHHRRHTADGLTNHKLLLTLNSPSRTLKTVISSSTTSSRSCQLSLGIVTTFSTVPISAEKHIYIYGVFIYIQFSFRTIWNRSVASASVEGPSILI